MQVAKNFSGKLNVDNVIEAVPDGDYMYMINGVVGASYNGKKGSVENMLGDSSITAYGSGYRCIGGCGDVANQRHFLFLCDTTVNNNHRIVEVKQNANGSTSTRNLYSGSSLNFSITYPVQATYVNKYIYYTDNYNAIKAAKVWETGQDPDLNNLIRRGGIYAPTFVKSTDSGVSINLIYNKEFQFAYQYVYDNNELSVLSPYSELCPPNLASQTFNKVTVSVPTLELIPDRVKKIKFAVRIGNDSAFQYIGTLDRVETNDFTTKSIAFFNSVYGGAVELDYETNYHDVPIKAKTIEFIKGRLWLANLVEGYDQPASPNMGIAVSSLETQNVGDPIYQYNTTFNYVKKYTYKVIDNGNGTETWYVEGSFGSGVENQFDKVYQGTNQGNNKSISGKRISSSPIVVNTISAYEIIDPNYSLNGDIPFGNAFSNLVPVGAQTTYTQTLSGTGTRTYYSYRIGDSFIDVLRTFVQAGDVTAFSGQKTFTNNSTYKVGVIYKDDDGRSSSVALANSDIITSSTTYSNRITAQWTLPQGSQPSTIPVWASSYHIVVSKNLTKSFFFEARAARLFYYKDSTTSNNYSVDNTGIKIDLTPVVNAGFSYTWSDGDRVVLYKPDGTNTYNLQINSFTGGYLLLSNTNIGSLSSGQNCILEIYKPKVVSEDVLYYEIGQGYAINNPGTSTRSFSTVTGDISGDTYNFLRDTYTYNGTAYVVSNSQTLFKQMSLDIKSLSWNTNAGKIHIISDKGQLTRPNTVKYSSPFIIGTEVNGLSEFYSSEQSEIPYENGEIMKLKSANKTSSDGTVLLAIGRNRVASMYIGETRLNINADTSYLVQGSQIVGEINTLNGWYGTNHPSSVFDDGKNVYWFSQERRAFVRYASNGIFPISEIKVSDFFNDVSSKSLTTDQTFVCGGYYPFYDMIMVTINHAGTYSLENYVTNNLEKTISYSDTNQAWVSFHSFVPDYYFDISDKMLTFRGGTIYRHDNSSSFNEYAGIKYYTKVKLPINNNPLNPKIWKTVQLFASPGFLRISNDGGEELSDYDENDIGFEIKAGIDQQTNTNITEMDVMDSVIYAPIGFDIFTNGQWSEGSDIVSTTLELTIEFKSLAFRHINLVNVGFIPAYGHDL